MVDLFVFQVSSFVILYITSLPSLIFHNSEIFLVFSMETATEVWWILALPYEYLSSSHKSLISASVIILLSWLVTVFLYWNYPGGTAWGKYYCKRRIHEKVKKIPGPKGLPILGSLSLMDSQAHSRLAATARRFDADRLMAFSLGETRAIVTCNPEVAKVILNSSIFVDRPDKESAYELLFHRSIGFAPYGDYWRNLRKIAGTRLFSMHQNRVSETIRSRIATDMSNAIRRASHQEIMVREILKWAALSNMMNLIFGRKYGFFQRNNEMEEVKTLVEEGYDLLGKLNCSDHISWLKRLDFQKIRSRCSKILPRVKEFVMKIIEEHREKPEERERDFVDALLSLEEQEKLSDSDMIAVLWEMIFRGTDTVTVLMEWTLARIVLHPEIQSKIHQELKNVIGESETVTEFDIPKLHYLQSTIKEVLRLHPPGPLLSWARRSISATVIDGYHIPENTTAMVNMWAITRDPTVWDEPLSFKPERFLEHEAYRRFELFGSDLRCAPFGSGRRSCPGKMLGLATVTLWVAVLVHDFEWLASEANPVDLSEKLRLSCEMSSPLTVRVRSLRT